MPHPRDLTDLSLAPVAVSIDRNLQSLRDLPPDEIEHALILDLNVHTARSTRSDRARWVLESSLRAVDLHGWQAEVTPDADRLRLTGGSVTLDLGLSATIRDYIEQGATGRGLKVVPAPEPA